MNFDIKSHLTKGVADALFTEDDNPKPQQEKPRPQAPVVDIPVPAIIRNVTSPYPHTAPAPVAADNPLLADLRTRTSFESTPIGQQLQSFITGLDDTGLSDTQKIKTSLKLSHITAASVIDTLNGLQALLATDKQKFDAQMTAATTKEVDGRQQNMANINSQIQELESQLNALRNTASDLATEIDSKTRQIQGLKDNYKAAFDTRSGEISTQISHYQSILQG
jgi:hypothetical protein